MPDDPKYRLGGNDEIDPAFWTEGNNLQTVIDALNSDTVPELIIKQSRLNLTNLPIPSIDGGNLDA